ncbi:MAG: transposase [Cyanobacteria bacterium J06635_10]
MQVNSLRSKEEVRRKTEEGLYPGQKCEDMKLCSSSLSSSFFLEARRASVNKQVSKLQRKVGNQRKNWHHHVSSDIASRHDIGVTEELRVKPMTRKAKKGSKRKKQKAGLNKSILDVGMSALNKMIGYKIEAKGGLLLILNTKKLKPSQRCPNCGTVHKHWADLSNRYHVCDSCGKKIERDKGSALVMYQTALSKQPGME